MMEKQLSIFDTGVLYDKPEDSREEKRPCDYSFLREIGQEVRRLRTGEILTITKIDKYYTELSDGSVATPYDITPWYSGDRLITIPDDIWEKRCRLCVHKAFHLNWPFPVSQIDRNVERPCRIIRFFQVKIPGECPNFQPHYGKVAGTCYSCKYNNMFHEGFCMKEDHKEQRRVYYSDGFSGDEKKRDYWGRHIQSVCDDYCSICGKDLLGTIEKR